MFKRFIFLAHLYANFEIKCKDDSWLMWFMGLFVKIFNPKWEEYATTFMNTIYLPRLLYDNPHEYQIPLIAHEGVHLRDRKRLTPPFYTFLYLFPQILAPLCLLSLLAIWSSNWWLLCLLFMGLLSPIPAPGRVYLEKRAYLMSLAAVYWMYNDWKFVESLIPRCVKQFTGRAYYFMGAGSKIALTDWFLSEIDIIRSKIYPDNFFEAVHCFLKEERDGT